MIRSEYFKGALWLILSPILFLMAAISTVKSLDLYYAQLILFSILALSGIVTGVGVILHKSWAKKLARYLCWILGAYLIGSWIVLVVWLVINFFNK